MRRGTTTNVVIEIWDAYPNTFMDVEIASPASDRGGVCPKIERTTPCDLVYSGAEQTDASGKARIVYTWRADSDTWSFPPGDYVVTVQDRHTAGVAGGVRFTVVG
ncbi:hypothetical protein ACQPXM_14825 [Kribbella sp. CA-253562]|uniref:hypothetical protein n=1 Tax=Kribbella sp. CA-253562 TaxID=3239942 RepID=UPI003D8DB5F3